MPSKQTGSNQKHQNEYAFRHNKNSKKTRKIAKTPNKGLCEKCHEKIEWRKKYRKYKPLTQPRKCNLCDQKNITLAYHVVCDPCAKDRKICAKCMEANSDKVHNEIEKKDHRAYLEEVEKSLSGLTLSKQHTLMRKINREEYEARERRRQERRGRGELESTTTGVTVNKEDLNLSDEEDGVDSDFEEDDDVDDDDDFDSDDSDEEEAPVKQPAFTKRRPVAQLVAKSKPVVAPVQEDSDSSDFDEDNYKYEYSSD